jgi:hypothetical protein
MTDTNPPADRTAEIRARLDAASKSTTMDIHAEGSILRASVSGGDRGRFVGGMGDLVAATVGETGPLTVTVVDDEDGRDATLALHARDDLAYLLKCNDKLQQLVDEAAYRLGDLVCDNNDLKSGNEQLSVRVEELERQLAAVRAMHKPERRYMAPDGEGSWDTAEECAADNDIPLDVVEHFDVCAHCGSIETGDDADRDYRESLWPCEGAKALGLAEEVRDEH